MGAGVWAESSSRRLLHLQRVALRTARARLRCATPSPLRVLVCGSRDWIDYPAIRDRLARLGPDTVVVHGAALGADAMGVKAASTLGMRTEGYPADWRGKGRRAGILRNLAMLDTKPDLVLAFQINGSRGTQFTIDEARKRGIPVEVFTT